MENNLHLALQNKLINLITIPQQQPLSNSPINLHPPTPLQNPKKDNSLTISYAHMQKMSTNIQNLIQKNFNNLIQLTITNCDLRTFQNFPKLHHLQNLNVSKNSLRGSFQFLVKNRQIKYLDVSNNIINDIKKFQPLRCLKTLHLFAKQNPFFNNIISTINHSKNSITQQLKLLGIKLLDQPRQFKKYSHHFDNCKNNQINVSTQINHKKQELTNNQKKSQRYLKILQKLARKCAPTQPKLHSLQNPLPQIHKISSQNFSNFLQLMKIVGQPKPSPHFTKIYRQKDQEHNKQYKDLTNFYQIIHPQQYHFNTLEQQYSSHNNQLIRSPLLDDQDDNQMDVNLHHFTSDKKQSNLLNQFQLNKQNDSNNSDSFHGIELESDMYEKDQE